MYCRFTFLESVWNAWLSFSIHHWRESQWDSSLTSSAVLAARICPGAPRPLHASPAARNGHLTDERGPRNCRIYAIKTKEYRGALLLQSVFSRVGVFKIIHSLHRCTLALKYVTFLNLLSKVSVRLFCEKLLFNGFNVTDLTEDNINKYLKKDGYCTLYYLSLTSIFY